MPSPIAWKRRLTGSSPGFDGSPHHVAHLPEEVTMPAGPEVIDRTGASPNIRQVLIRVSAAQQLIEELLENSPFLRRQHIEIVRDPFVFRCR